MIQPKGMDVAGGAYIYNRPEASFQTSKGGLIFYLAKNSLPQIRLSSKSFPKLLVTL
jgi:hypothetical protein